MVKFLNLFESRKIVPYHVHPLLLNLENNINIYNLPLLHNKYIYED